MRPANDPTDGAFKPLAALLKSWNKPVGPPGFAGGAPAPEPAAAEAPAEEPAAAPAPVELPEGDDLLSASLGQLNLQAAAVPAAAPAAAPAPVPVAAPEPVPAPEPATASAPAASDPVVDPSLVKRSASSQLLQQQLSAQPGGQMLPPLPLGGPLAQLQAMGSGSLHPDLLVAAAGHFGPQQHPQAQHPMQHPGLLGGQDPFLQQHHQHPLLAPSQQLAGLPPAPLAHLPLGAQALAAQQPQAQAPPAELPAWLTEPAAPVAPQPAPVAQPQQPEPVPAPAPAPAPAPSQAAPRAPSLLEIQREQEAQEAERRRREVLEAQQRAVAEEQEAARRQQEAALLAQGYEQEEEEGSGLLLPPPPPPRAPSGPRPETKVAPWAAAAPKKKTGGWGRVQVAVLSSSQG